MSFAKQAHRQIHHVIGGPMRELAKAALATVREALNPAAFTEAFATGREMTIEDAFATVLTQQSISGAVAETSMLGRDSTVYL